MSASVNTADAPAKTTKKTKCAADRFAAWTERKWAHAKPTEIHVAAALETPFGMAAAGVKIARTEERGANVTHNAALAALEAVDARVPEIAPPAALVVRTPPMTITIEGKSVDAEAYDFIYSSAGMIEESDTLSPERKSEMIEALHAWERQKADAGRKLGLSAATKAEAQAHKGYMAAYHRLEDALRAAVLAPAASDKERRKQASLLRELDAMGADFERIARDLVLRPTSPTEPPPTAGADPAAVDAWNAARQDYEAAKAAQNAEEVASRAANFTPIFDDFPAEVVRRSSRGYPVHLRWLMPEYLDDDVTLSSAERARLRPIVSEWAERFGERLHATRDDAEADDLYDAADAAEDRLLALDPPNIEALIYAQQLVARETDGDHLGYDDVSRVAFLLADGYDTRNAVRQHMALLKLSGVTDHPMFEAEEFSPALFRKAYESHGGVVAAQHDDLILGHAEEDSECAGMRASLAAKPWKYHALYLVAEAARETGGDPLFSSLGHRRPIVQVRPPRAFDFVQFCFDGRERLAVVETFTTPIIAMRAAQRVAP